MARQKAEPAVEKLRAALVKVLASLVAAPSENPPGSTDLVAATAEQFLASYGISCRRHSGAPGKINLVASVGSGTPGLVLCGHLDTVPAGDERRWSHGPFSGRVDEGSIYGRGSADMKGGVAAILTALVALTRLERILPSAVAALLVCDEETGGKLGAKWCIDNKLVNGKAVIIGEPTNTRRGGHAVVAGERGILWLRLFYHGEPAHGSLPTLGQNAITNSIEHLVTFRNPFFRRVRPPHAARTLVSAGKRLLQDEFGRRGRMAPQRSLDRYTVNLGVIQGGTTTNVVPDSCTAELDIRIPLGGSREEAEAMIRPLAGDCRIETFNYAPPSFTAPSSQIAALVRQVARRTFKEDTPYLLAPYTTDGHYFRTIAGMPTIVYGPGFTDVIHRYDETVGLEDVVGCAKVYAATALAFGG